MTVHTIQLPRARTLLERGVAEGLHLGGQLYVSRGPSPDAERTELVFGERAPGEPMTSDTLMLWLSSTKPLVAVALGQLWERGLFDLDDPVARHLPDFAAHGKDRITIRHLLTHTGGIRMFNFGWPDASWDEIVANICRSRPEPRWVPGEQAGYHLSSSWFLLGELVRRLDGRPYSSYVRAEICEPLGMDNTWVGMPAERFQAYGERIGKMYGTERTLPKDGESEGAGNGEVKDGETERPGPLLRPWHREPYVTGCSPGGNGFGPIRELGRFYEMLLGRGRLGETRILRPQALEALTAVHRAGLFDKTFQQKLDWGLGFIVNSQHYGTDLVAYGYGRHASRRTFGHSGFQSSTGFADPIHGVVVALAVNGNPGEPRHTERFRDLTEAIYEDLGLAGEPAAEGTT